MPLLRRQNKWRSIAALLAFLCVGMYGFHSYERWKTLKIVTFPTPACDLRAGPCIANLATGEQIELHIKPTHMPVLTSVQLEVKTKKIPIKKISISFKGAEMNMGEFSYNLLPQKDGTYACQTILPTCIQDQMAWHAVIHIESLHKHYNAPFLFINQRPANA